MADSKLTQTFTTDDTKLLASYDKILRRQMQVLDATSRIAAESKKESERARAALDSQGSALGKLFSQVQGIATSWLSVRTAVDLANTEIQRQIDLQAKAKQAQISVADARSSFLRNAVALSPAERQRAVQTVEEIALRTGVDQRKLFVSAGSALSAAGDRTLDDVLAAVQVAARFVPGESGEPEAVAGGLLDIASLTKTNDAIANLGVLSATQAKARVTTTEETARNLVPAAINVASYGGSPAEALSLVAAMTNAIKDYTGRQSGTSTIRLAQQLGEFFKPGEIRKEITEALTEKPGGLGVAQTNPAIAAALDRFVAAEKGGVPGLARLKAGDTAAQVEFLKHNEALAEKFIQQQIEYRTAGGALQSTASQIGFLQQHPELANAFFNRDEFGASFEAKPSKQIQELLTNPQSEIARNFLAFQGVIPTAGEARALGEKALGDVEGDPLARQAQMARRLESLSDRLLTGNIQAGEGGIARESLEKLLQATGLGALASKLDRLDFELKTGFGTHDTFDALTAAMERRIGDLRYRAVKPGEMLFSNEPVSGGYFQRSPETGEFSPVPSVGTLDVLGRQNYVRRRDEESNRQADLLEETLETLRGARERRGNEGEAPAPAAPASDFEAANLRRSGLGGLESYGLADEFDMLAAGRPAAEFTGEHGNLRDLGSFINGQMQHVRETSGDPAALAVLERIAERIDATQKELAALNAKTAAAADENRAANRSAGARATVGAGRE